MPDAYPDRDELAALEQELREAVARLDPVPEHLRRQAEAGFTWRTVDAELAVLVYDSSMVAEPALVRGGDQPRLLTFRTDDLSIEVAIPGAGEPGLVGQLVPGQPAEVEVQQAGQRLAVGADRLGRFTVTPPAAGPLRLHCRPPAGRPVVTDWFSR
jgi:hypothetical protein